MMAWREKETEKPYRELKMHAGIGVATFGTKRD